MKKVVFSSRLRVVIFSVGITSFELSDVTALRMESSCDVRSGPSVLSSLAWDQPLNREFVCACLNS